MPNLYKKFTATDAAKNRDGGYKNVIYLAPVDTFLSIKKPTDTPAALGDTKKITTAHTFTSPAGFISLVSKMHAVKTKTTSIGDDGVQQMEHEFEAIITGDSAEHLEQFEGLLNDNCIFLVKDQNCLAANEFVQFGDECLQPTLKVEFDSADTNSGVKYYKITGKIRGKKYFYSGVVTEKSYT
jgi:hypothetical protein